MLGQTGANALKPELPTNQSRSQRSKPFGSNCLRRKWPQSIPLLTPRSSTTTRPKPLVNPLYTPRIPLV
jgi:hypothetical protein